MPLWNCRMYRRVALAASYPELGDIAQQYDISVKSMTLWYSHLNPGFAEEFRYYTHDEVEKERDDRLDEIDASLALTLLASIEASFRVDYLRRCYRRRMHCPDIFVRSTGRRADTSPSKKNCLMDGVGTATYGSRCWETSRTRSSIGTGWRMAGTGCQDLAGATTFPISSIWLIRWLNGSRSRSRRTGVGQ